MNVILHGTSPDGMEDSIKIQGSSEEDLRANCYKEAAKRGWKHCWAEDLEGEEK